MPSLAAGMFGRSPCVGSGRRWHRIQIAVLPREAYKKVDVVAKPAWRPHTNVSDYLLEYAVFGGICLGFRDGNIEMAASKL